MSNLKNVETSLPRQMKGMTLLAIDFIASDEDAICGRGSNCFNHTGNRKFRQIIDSNLIQYSNALTKFEKTTMICNIVNYIRTNSPTGTGFVKKDLDSGRYFDVGDYMAVRCSSFVLFTALCKDIFLSLVSAFVFDHLQPASENSYIVLPSICHKILIFIEGKNFPSIP